MKTLDWATLSNDERDAALARPPATASEERIAAVQRIVEQVRADGDVALRAIGPCAVTLARAESLEAHAQSVVRRLEALT